MPRYRLVVEPAALVCSRLRAAIAGRGIKLVSYAGLRPARGCGRLRLLDRPEHRRQHEEGAD